MYGIVWMNVCTVLYVIVVLKTIQPVVIITQSSGPQPPGAGTSHRWNSKLSKIILRNK